MPDAAVPDQGDDPAAQLAEAHAALRRSEAELRRLHGLFSDICGTVQTDFAAHMRVRDDLIAEQRRHIQALNLTLTQERARRLRPKSERGAGKPARRA